MTYPGYHHVKADVLTIPKMWYFLRFGGFEPELLAVKVGSILDQKFSSLPTLSSHNSCSKPQNLENYHIFRILRTSAFRWYHPR